MQKSSFLSQFMESLDRSFWSTLDNLMLSSISFPVTIFSVPGALYTHFSMPGALNLFIEVLYYSGH